MNDFKDKVALVRRMQAALSEANELGSVVTLDEIARAIQPASGGDASFMTGAIVTLDGSYTVQ